jgi:hypothetical protein
VTPSRPAVAPRGQAAPASRTGARAGRPPVRGTLPSAFKAWLSPGIARRADRKWEAVRKGGHGGVPRSSVRQRDAGRQGPLLGPCVRAAGPVLIRRSPRAARPPDRQPPGNGAAGDAGRAGRRRRRAPACDARRAAGTHKSTLPCVNQCASVACGVARRAARGRAVLTPAGRAPPPCAPMSCGAWRPVSSASRAPRTSRSRAGLVVAGAGVACASRRDRARAGRPPPTVEGGDVLPLETVPPRRPAYPVVATLASERRLLRRADISCSEAGTASEAPRRRRLPPLRQLCASPVSKGRHFIAPAPGRRRLSSVAHRGVARGVRVHATLWRRACQAGSRPCEDLAAANTAAPAGRAEQLPARDCQRAIPATFTQRRARAAGRTRRTRLGQTTTDAPQESATAVDGSGGDAIQYS